ncbi:hypothetical protein QMK56_10225 [Pseudomonas protegens]|uniref:hypothetical protein n=1 Tax=Pseudomonas protegens TaxID=380021 RepID=UPI002A358D64|nr:hypothetical protein [Pseudomonas protegens]MDX9681872.1 hypothetical protein [Pseudomonas protegens]
MRTLDHWAHRLLQVPLLIECPSMQVIGYDHEEPLFIGPGHISITSRTEMEFVMHGKPTDAQKAYKHLMHANENPFVNLDQLRVLAIDYEGVEWNCGWADVRMGDTAQGIWRLSGSLQAMMTMASGTRVRREASVEVVYDAWLDVPIPLLTRKAVRERADSMFSSGDGVGQQHIVEVEGGRIAFSQTWNDHRLWVSASGFEPLPGVFLENWIGEPLNILLGQLVYPRLIARNMGDGTALVALRNVSEHAADTRISSLLCQSKRRHSEAFWEMYRLLMSMIIRAGQEKTEPNLEMHPLTHFYQEIAQATTGSHWVLCMTLASAIEGVTNLMFPAPKQVRVPDDEADAWETSIRSLEAHVLSWEGERKLRERLMDSLRLVRAKGVVQRLKPLVDSGTIDKEHLEAWRRVRNSVMHGNLVSPWLTEELEQKLNRLAELTHRLSEAYIRQCAE